MGNGNSANGWRLVPPAFASQEEYASRHEDLNFWWPYITEILDWHQLADTAGESVAGAGGTYPTFICGKYVVKLFGFIPWWQKDYAAERTVSALFARDPEILCPRLIAEGQLFDDAANPWPYLVTERMSGTCWHDAKLSADQRLSVAADLGRQLRRVHALEPSGVQSDENWPTLNFKGAAERISFPAHLVAQMDDYLSRLGPFDRVLVHGDLFSRHPFVKDGRLTGIIDWGDAVVTDRHYELAKLHLDTFECDKSLLRVFLNESAWLVDKDFPHRALGLALYRQAVHFARGSNGDVFYLVKDLFPLQDIATLDELAIILFAV